MDLGWSPLGAFGVTVMVLAGAMGAFIYATRPDRSQNRLLALALVLGGISIGFYFGGAVLADDEATARLAIGIGVTFLIPLPAVYLRFLSTLRTPLTRPLASTPALVVLIAYTLAVWALWFARPRAFFDPLLYYPSIDAWHVVAAGPFLDLALAALAVTEIFGLIVAVSAYRRAERDSAREQARAFAYAFGTRDLFGTAFIVCFAALPGLTWSLGPVLFVLTLPAVDLLFYALLAYGILRVQLFDIDLRVKTAIRQGTVAAPFAATFFTVSEALEAMIPVDSTWLGLGAAGAIVLALRPIRAFAERFANTLMPGVVPTGAYIDARKHHVYRSAVEGILEDGRVTAAERRVLERLRGELGIDPSDAEAIEADAERRFGESRALAPAGPNGGRPVTAPSRQERP